MISRSALLQPPAANLEWKDDRTFLPVELEQTWTIGELLAGPVTQLRRGAALFAYAEALASGLPADADTVRARLAEAEAVHPEDAELAEIRSVLDAL